jgi:hypothetical protein
LSGKLLFPNKFQRKFTFSWANFEKKVTPMKVVFSSYLDPEFEGAALELAGWGITLSKVS